MSIRHRPAQLLSMAVLTACMGLIAFSGVAGNPRFEAIHTLDVIRLMTAGAAVAVTIVLLVLFLKSRRRSEDVRAGGTRGEGSN